MSRCSQCRALLGWCFHTDLSEDDEVTVVQPVDPLLLEVCALKPRATVQMVAVEWPAEEP